MLSRVSRLGFSLQKTPSFLPRAFSINGNKGDSDKAPSNNYQPEATQTNSGAEMFPKNKKPMMFVKKRREASESEPINHPQEKNQNQDQTEVNATESQPKPEQNNQKKILFGFSRSAERYPEDPISLNAKRVRYSQEKGAVFSLLEQKGREWDMPKDLKHTDRAINPATNSDFNFRKGKDRKIYFESMFPSQEAESPKTYFPVFVLRRETYSRKQFLDLLAYFMPHLKKVKDLKEKDLKGNNGGFDCEWVSREDVLGLYRYCLERWGEKTARDLFEKLCSTFDFRNADLNFLLTDIEDQMRPKLESKEPNVPVLCGLLVDQMKKLRKIKRKVSKGASKTNHFSYSDQTSYTQDIIATAPKVLTNIVSYLIAQAEKNPSLKPLVSNTLDYYFDSISTNFFKTFRTFSPSSFYTASILKAYFLYLNRTVCYQSQKFYLNETSLIKVAEFMQNQPVSSRNAFISELLEVMHHQKIDLPGYSSFRIAIDPAGFEKFKQGCKDSPIIKYNNTTVPCLALRLACSVNDLEYLHMQKDRIFETSLGMYWLECYARVVMNVNQNEKNVNWVSFFDKIIQAKNIHSQKMSLEGQLLLKTLCNLSSNQPSESKEAFRSLSATYIRPSMIKYARTALIKFYAENFKDEPALDFNAKNAVDNLMKRSLEVELVDLYIKSTTDTWRNKFNFDRAYTYGQRAASYYEKMDVSFEAIYHYRRLYTIFGKQRRSMTRIVRKNEKLLNRQYQAEVSEQEKKYEAHSVPREEMLADKAHLLEKANLKKLQTTPKTKKPEESTEEGEDGKKKKVFKPLPVRRGNFIFGVELPDYYVLAPEKENFYTDNAGPIFKYFLQNMTKEEVLDAVPPFEDENTWVAIYILDYALDTNSFNALAVAEMLLSIYRPHIPAQSLERYHAMKERLTKDPSRFL